MTLGALEVDDLAAVVKYLREEGELAVQCVYCSAWYCTTVPRHSGHHGMACWLAAATIST